MDHRHHDPDPNPPGDRRAAAPRRRLNLGILAHVDAGKTTLTEALLAHGGAIEHRGRVDDGTTQTDTLAVERRRGITVRAAVATFHTADVAVTIVDTPGHPDFIAEVDRSLAVLDAAVLVVSGVEGVQAQTVVLFRALRRAGVPTVVFVNKTDRPGADVTAVAAQLSERLGPPVIMVDPVIPAAAAGGSDRASRTADEQVCAALAEHDDGLLASWVEHGVPSRDRLWRSLRELTRTGAVLPGLSGSARTTDGVDRLVATLLRVCPTVAGEDGGPATGQIFAIERDDRRERICLIRLRSGTLTVRDHVVLGPGREGTVTTLACHRPGGVVPARQAHAGEVVRVAGLHQARIGDWLGPSGPRRPTAASFPPPGLQVRVRADDPARSDDLLVALGELADVDPLIGLHTDRGDLRLELYGLVQQEVIAETLDTEYGIAVAFDPATVICVERPARRGRAAVHVGESGHTDPVTLGLVVEPAVPGSGVSVEVAAERGTLPLHVYGTREGFASAVLEYLTAPLAAGPHGWPVTDLVVTVVESGYPPAAPRVAEVRRTTALVIEAALADAGTVVCEPVDRVRVECPAESVAAVVNLLARHRADLEPPVVAGRSASVGALVPTRSVDAVRRELDAVSGGRATAESRLDHYAAMTTDHAPTGSA